MEKLAGAFEKLIFMKPNDLAMLKALRRLSAERRLKQHELDALQRLEAEASRGLREALRLAKKGRKPRLPNAGKRRIL